MQHGINWKENTLHFICKYVIEEHHERVVAPSAISVVSLKREWLESKQDGGQRESK